MSSNAAKAPGAMKPPGFKEEKHRDQGEMGEMEDAKPVFFVGKENSYT